MSTGLNGLKKEKGGGSLNREIKAALIQTFCSPWKFRIIAAFYLCGFPCCMLLHLQHIGCILFGFSAITSPPHASFCSATVFLPTLF